MLVHKKFPMTANGKVKRRIGPDFDTLFRPRFSPDGKTMSFIGADAGRPGMYLMDLETEEVEALHTGALESFDSSWSPDGEKIAFTAIAPGAIDSLELFSQVNPHNKPQRDIFLMDVEDGCWNCRDSSRATNSSTGSGLLK